MGILMMMRQPSAVFARLASTCALCCLLAAGPQSRASDQKPDAGEKTKAVASPAKLSVRQRALAVYDADGDGRLNAAEREAIRRDGSPFAVERPVFRRGWVTRDKAWIKKHDKDGDGKLNADEQRAANVALRKLWGQLVGKYAAFKDDRPVVANLKKMERDAKEGKIEGFPLELYGWIRGSIARADPKNRKSRRRGESGHPLAQFDTDKNGLLDAGELQAIRTAIANKKPSAADKKPSAADKKP